MTTETEISAPGKPTPLMGLVILVCTTLAIGIYGGIAYSFGIVPLYAGFVFALYFGVFKMGALEELPAAVLGCLGGILLAAGLHVLPALWGPPGLYLELFLIAVSVYLFTLGWATMVINPGFMLLLTVATIPSVQGDARFVGMAGAVLVAAGMLGAAMLAGQWIAARKTRVSQAHPAPGQ